MVCELKYLWILCLVIELMISKLGFNVGIIVFMMVLLGLFLLMIVLIFVILKLWVNFWYCWMCFFKFLCWLWIKFLFIVLYIFILFCFKIEMMVNLVLLFLVWLMVYWNVNCVLFELLILIKMCLNFLGFIFDIWFYFLFFDNLIIFLFLLI